MPPSNANAARLLESMDVAFELRCYELTEEHFDAEAVARKAMMSPEQVYETLVARGDRTGALFAGDQHELLCHRPSDLTEPGVS